MSKRCKQCDAEIKNRFLDTYCLDCVEASIDNVTMTDIEAVTNALEAKIKAAKAASK